MSVRLPQPRLHELFLEDVGSYARDVVDNGRKPVRMYLDYPYNRNIKAYIWNCTAPPGGRSIDEFKVQLILEGQKRGERGCFDDSDGSTILIIGYATPFVDLDSGLWVLFELDKHRDFAYSANIQIYLRQLLVALEQPVFIHKKHNEETVVISKRQYLQQALKERFRIDDEIMLERSMHAASRL